MFVSPHRSIVNCAPALRSFLQCDCCDEYSCRDCSRSDTLPDGTGTLALTGGCKGSAGQGQSFFECADCGFTICETCCTPGHVASGRSATRFSVARPVARQLAPVRLAS